VAVVAGLGAVWGAVAFAVLWGYTSIQVTRPFVQSLPGLVSLLPVRLVLFGIHLVEDHVVGRPLQLSANHEWIGFVSAAVGALLTTAGYLATRWLMRSIRPTRAGPGP
jgi:hypothetical protein